MTTPQDYWDDWSQDDVMRFPGTAARLINESLRGQGKSDCHQASQTDLPTIPLATPNIPQEGGNQQNQSDTSGFEIAVSPLPNGEYGVTYQSPCLSLDLTLPAQECDKLRQVLLDNLIWKLLQSTSQKAV